MLSSNLKSRTDLQIATLPSITVLLVTALADQVTLIRRVLKNGTRPYELVHSPTIAEATDYLQLPHQPDVIISDYTFVKTPTIAALKNFRRLTAQLPLISFVDPADESVAIQALRKTGQEYLVKGSFDAETLRRTIRYAIERKKFQAEVERSRKRARRLHQITSALKQQSEQLFALNKAKDDFISLASHQLRTPATGVKQYLGLLLEGYAGNMSSQQREFLALAYDSNERQLKIVSDLLRTAQLDAGHVNLQMEHVDIASLAKAVIEEQYVQVRARDQQIHMQIPNNLRPVVADAGKLRMALENLIDNASKYTPHGKQIYVRVTQTDPSGTVITIRDEGVGINLADRQKIFEKFARVSNVLSDHVGGSGLGLYWVKQIINLHGGTVSVASKPGQGTSFIINLSGKIT